MKKEAIAIVGIGTIFPGSQNYASFWNNSLDAKCFIQEIPKDFWSIEDFYDLDPLATDKTYSKMAGVLNSVDFDPIEFGISPKSMQSIGVDQLYGLVLARQALIDAKLYGKNAKAFDKTRTGVIMAASVSKNVYQLSARTNAVQMKQFMRNCNIPTQIIDEVIKNYKNGITGWEEDSNPGYLANVVSGRIASRFDFSGTTCSVDSACASGLTAVKFAAQELMLGNCDVMLAGGITLDLSNVTFVSFCKTPALSQSDCIRPFDSRADGMLLGDGAGAVVLKRLSTAEADGDRIYAVIEGLGSSSDGREKSIFSPNKRGQTLAINRALEAARVKPEQIGMIEAHGTGTLVGDSCEIEALKEVFGNVNQEERSLVLGGSKGQTGHMRLAAGIANLIRASLAIYHKQFLPTVGCEQLNENLEQSIFSVCQKPYPWIVNKNQPVRYACVSAFGFGGTNYNAIIREYQQEHMEPYRYSNLPQGIILWGSGKEALLKEIEAFIRALKSNPQNLYASQYTYRKMKGADNRIGFAVRSVREAIEKAEYAIKVLRKEEKEFWHIKGIVYIKKKWIQNVKIVALFPGQGSQHHNMLADIAGAYPEMRKILMLIDNELIDKGLDPVSNMIYAKTWSAQEDEQITSKLQETQYTQPALGAIEAGLYEIMKSRGFSADMLIGHSFGELTALYVANAFDQTAFIQLAVARGRYMSECSKEVKETGMMAIKESSAYVKRLIASFEDVYIANQNSPEQTIIAGTKTNMEKIGKIAHKEGIQTLLLNVSAAFHTPFMKNAQGKIEKNLSKLNIHKPTIPVYANCKAKEYTSAKTVLSNLSNQLIKPVLFQKSVENAYDNGGRVFIEIGPGNVLTGLTKKCLVHKEECMVISTASGEDSLLQLESAFTYLSVLGLPIEMDRYSKKVDVEIENTKTKHSYSVPSTYFYLPETKKELIEARDKKMKQTRIGKAIYKDLEENDDMNKYDAMYEIHKLNTAVVEGYVKGQNGQLEQIEKLLGGESFKTDEDRKLLFKYATNSQDHCLDALKIYFEGQSGFDKIEDVKTEEVVEQVSLNQVSERAFHKSEMQSEKSEEEVHIDINPPVEKLPELTKEIDREAIKKLVISTIVEITGYPDDMLEIDMELEGDLGIDSIKRLELFSNINDKLGHIFGQEDMVTLAAVQTINECIDIIKSVQEDPNHTVWSQEDIDVVKNREDDLEDSIL